MAAQKPTIWFAAASFWVKPRPGEDRCEAVACLYHPDYLKGHDNGDDPHRYFRW